MTTVTDTEPATATHSATRPRWRWGWLVFLVALVAAIGLPWAIAGLTGRADRTGPAVLPDRIAGLAPFTTDVEVEPANPAVG